MRRAVLLIALLALAGVAAFAVCYRFAMRPVHVLPGDLPTELAWLRTEFRLDDATFAKVRALHESYEPRCMENCEKIARVNQRISALATKGAPAPAEMDAALAEAADLHRKCRGDMWRHIEEVAALLPAEKAQRYRAMMARVIVNPGVPYEHLPAY